MVRTMVLEYQWYGIDQYCTIYMVPYGAKKYHFWYHSGATGKRVIVSINDITVYYHWYHGTMCTVPTRQRCLQRAHMRLPVACA